MLSDFGTQQSCRLRCAAAESLSRQTKRVTGIPIRCLAGIKQGHRHCQVKRGSQKVLRWKGKILPQTKQHRGIVLFIYFKKVFQRSSKPAVLEKRFAICPVLLVQDYILPFGFRQQN